MTDLQHPVFPLQQPVYVGRFAPTPSGPLHMGSLVAALGSFLDARAHNGRWLLRIEDIDRPRTVVGATEAILTSLAKHGLQWDDEIVFQSTRYHAYETALALLEERKRLFRCSCSRQQVMASARLGPAGPVYPGYCRHKQVDKTQRHALRFLSDDDWIEFVDRLLGPQRFHGQDDIGDFILRRSDGIYAYHLAVVVDDADAGVTDVVRGADLLASTAAHIQLQRALGIPTPRYCHLPLVLGQNGQKLSKQNGAAGLDDRFPEKNLNMAAHWLGLPPLEHDGSIEDRLSTWIEAWRQRHSISANTSPVPQS